jgi:hypothetical protein
MVSTRRLAITAPSHPPADSQPNHLDGNSFAALADLDEVMQDAPAPPQSPTDPAAHTSLVEFVPCEEPRTLQLTTLPENTLTTLEDLPDLPSLDVATVASLPDFTGLDLTVPHCHAFSTEDTQRQRCQRCASARTSLILLMPASLPLPILYPRASMRPMQFSLILGTR